jgi:hypothetical protein
VHEIETLHPITIEKQAIFYLSSFSTKHIINAASAENREGERVNVKGEKAIVLKSKAQQPPRLLLAFHLRNRPHTSCLRTAP